MNKRNKRGPLRAQRQRSIIVDGVYNNPHFMHAATSQVGNTARVKTASGAVWEGIFKTFSGNFEVVLELAVKVANPESSESHLITESLVEKLIFKPSDIISMGFKDVDLDYATRDTFQTDTAIAARLNGNKFEERELEPWDSGAMNGDGALELDSAANGWDPNDMFRKNEQEYGVQSTFDHSLRGYTVPLENRDTADYKEAQARAEQIAAEIENQPAHKARLELENGDEEERFAAVVRPSAPDSSASNGKYIPPAKRKGNQNNGKLLKSTPPPSSISTSNSSSSQGQSSPSPKDSKPPIYPAGRNDMAHQSSSPLPNTVHISNPHSNPPPHTPPQAPAPQQPQPMQQQQPPATISMHPAVPPPQQQQQASPPQQQQPQVMPQQQQPPPPQQINQLHPGQQNAAGQQYVGQQHGGGQPPHMNPQHGGQQTHHGPPPQMAPHPVGIVVSPNPMVPPPGPPIHPQVMQPIPHGVPPRPHSHTPPHLQTAPPQVQYAQPPRQQGGVVPPPGAMVSPVQPHPPHGVPMQPKLHNQMNGEIKMGPQQRQQRHYEAQQQQQQRPQPYQTGPPLNQDPLPHQMVPPPQRHQGPPPPPQTHRQTSQPQDEQQIKELHQFAQEFKLAPAPMASQGDQPISPHPVVSPGPQNIMMDQGPPPQQVIPSPQPRPPQQHQQQQQQQKPQPQPSPPQPAQSPLQRSSHSPPQSPSDMDKIANTLSKSKLNPNAKEFVLNPTAKPFQPRWEGSVRSPSTPSASRPHTPQTPSHSPYIPSSVAGPGQPGPMPQVLMPVYPVMPPAQYHTQPPPGNRIKRMPSIQMRADVTSQMQVAAATGQPLLAPAPIQQFITYAPTAGAHQMNHTAYQSTAAAAAAMHAATIRMYDAAAAAAASGAPPQIQYLPAHPQPSGTPSPAQQQSYNHAAASLGQAPQGPPTQYQHTFQAVPPQQAPQQIPMAFCIPTQPHLMPNMQYIQQTPPPPNHHQQHAHMQAVLMQQAQAQAQAAGQHVVAAGPQSQGGHPGQQGGNHHGGPNP